MIYMRRSFSYAIFNLDRHVTVFLANENAQI